MDSPGFCAQYCTYSVMDNGSKQIICIVNIDKRETMRNSVIMEKEGFMRAFDKLCEELNIDEFCTDAHSQISALFSKFIGLICFRRLFQQTNSVHIAPCNKLHLHYYDWKMIWITT